PQRRSDAGREYRCPVRVQVWAGPSNGVWAGVVDAVRHGRPSEDAKSLAKRRDRRRRTGNRRWLLHAPARPPLHPERDASRHTGRVSQAVLSAGSNWRDILRDATRAVTPPSAAWHAGA